MQPFRGSDRMSGAALGVCAYLVGCITPVLSDEETGARINLVPFQQPLGWLVPPRQLLSEVGDVTTEIKG